MKKSILVLFLFSLVASGAFTQNIALSAGGGAQFDLGVPLLDYDGFDVYFGGYVFFDATYVELSGGVGYYRLTDPGLYGTSLRFSLLGKYNLSLWGFDLFPLLGIRFSVPLNMSLDGNSVSEFMVGDNIRLGFQAGVGKDFSFGESLFMRASLLYNMDLYAPGANPFNDIFYSIGPIFRIGLGRKF